MKIIGKKYQKGFGIMEVLVSGVIIIIILAALVFIVRAAMNNSMYLQQRAQAIYLAQEGIELSRQIRDSNWIDGSNTTQWDDLWDNGGSIEEVIKGCYQILYNDNGDNRHWLTDRGIVADLDACKAIDKQNIEVDQVTFNRKIYIDRDTFKPGELIPDDTTAETNVYPANNAIKVTAIINWDFNGQAKSVDVSEIITNWRPSY